MVIKSYSRIGFQKVLEVIFDINNSTFSVIIQIFGGKKKKAFKSDKHINEKRKQQIYIYESRTKDEWQYKIS